MSIFDKRRDPAEEAARSTDFDTMPEGAAEARVKPLTDREIARALAEDTLCELQRLNATMSAMAAAQRSQLSNEVLEAGTFVFPSDGVIVRHFHTQIGSVVVANATGYTVTVQAGTSPSAAAPTSGNGVQIVPNNAWMGIPIASHAVTLYGQAGTSVSLQCFASMFGLGVR